MQTTKMHSTLPVYLGNRKPSILMTSITQG